MCQQKLLKKSKKLLKKSKKLLKVGKSSSSQGVVVVNALPITFQTSWNFNC